MLLHVHPDNPNPRDIKAIAEILRKNGVIIYPTDTVYALGWSIESAKAFDQIVLLKGKEARKEQFSMICTDISQATNYTLPLSNPIFRLMKRNLPGPFTFILPANNQVPKFYKQKKKTVGIRIPAHNVPRAIVQELGHPIMTTSIHKADDTIQEYFADASLLHDSFEKQVDAVVDGGYGQLTPSTVVDCTSNEPEIVRQGIGDLLF